MQLHGLLKKKKEIKEIRVSEAWPFTAINSRTAPPGFFVVVNITQTNDQHQTKPEAPKLKFLNVPAT